MKTNTVPRRFKKIEPCENLFSSVFFSTDQILKVFLWSDKVKVSDKVKGIKCLVMTNVLLFELFRYECIINDLEC